MGPAHRRSSTGSGLTLVDRDGSMGTPLGEVDVRQAINHAFDREAILEGIAGGHGTVTTQVFRADSPGFDPALDEAYPYDPETAKELLAEAGYADGFTLDMPTTAALGETTFAIIARPARRRRYRRQLRRREHRLLRADPRAQVPRLPHVPRAGPQRLAVRQLPALGERGVEPVALHRRDVGGADRDDPDHRGRRAGGGGRRARALRAPSRRGSPRGTASKSNYATDSNVDVVIQTGNAVPYLFNFSPQG